MRDELDSVLVEVKNLKKYFPIEEGLFSSGKLKQLRAVDGVSLSIFKGETFGLVGESGCGKSTLSRLILRLLEPDDGEVYFNTENITKLSKESMRRIRKKMQIIFQNPFASLNPRMTVGAMLTEVLEVYNYPKNKIKDRIFEILELVGLEKNDLEKYPHEFSGGQRQRIGISRALAVQPDFIIADEPVSSLDVSIQSQIVNLLMDLQDKIYLTYLFISHDLALVRYVASRIGVMYLGQIMEIADSSEFYSKPIHPYTRMLLSSLPKFYSEKTDIGGIVPEADGPSLHEKYFAGSAPACVFHTRCSQAMPECNERKPELKEVSKGHFVRCLKYN